MKYDAAGKTELEQVEARVARKLAEIHQMLAPGLAVPFTLDELQRAAETRMAVLPAADQERLRLKAIVAYAELEDIIEELSQHLAGIAAELHKVSHHSRAATAYGQAPRGRARFAVGL